MFEFTEQDAIDSQSDRDNLERLHTDLDAMTKHEAAMRLPLVVRRLIDSKIDPVVIAKTLLIGDRKGGHVYQLSARAPALSPHEMAAESAISLALVGVPYPVAATLLVAGACWLAVQFGIDRQTLVSICSEPARPWPGEKTPGVLDLVDSKGVATRLWLMDAIANAQLPEFAPMKMVRA